MVLHILPDIPEMDRDCFPDIDLFQCGSKRFCQLTGIIIGSVCGAKARHGHCINISPGNPQHIKCPYGHKQCQCGVQATGNTNDCLLTAGMGKTLFQSHGLDHKNLIAAFFPFLPV